MRFSALLLLGALLPAVAAGADPASVAPIPIPKPDPWTELKCDVGVPVPLSAGASKVVSWKLIDEAGASLVQVPGSTSAVFYANKAGRYRFASIADGKPEWCAMTAGKAPAPEPDPDPKPADDLTRALQAAFKADPGANKLDLATLTAIYLEAADQTDSATYATAGELYSILRKIATDKLADRLLGVRKLLAADLTMSLPIDVDAPFTDENRKSAKETFKRFAKALQGVTP